MDEQARTMDLGEFFSEATLTPAMVAAEALSLLDMYEKQEPGTIIRFGFQELDKNMSMVKGNYYLIAARPGAGKTALALQVAGYSVTQLPDDHIVMVFSAEMSPAALAMREACARTRLNHWDAVKGNLTKEQYATLRQAINDRGNSRIYVNGSSAPSLEFMAEQCELVESTGKQVGFIVFDYVQLAGEMAEGNEKARVDKISRGLAGLAKRFDCPVLGLSQTNRKKSEDSEPGMHWLMYGGEQQPSGIIIMEPSPENRELIYLHIVKHRHGPSGATVPLQYDRSSMRFSGAVVRPVDLNDF